MVNKQLTTHLVATKLSRIIVLETSFPSVHYAWRCVMAKHKYVHEFACA